VAVLAVEPAELTETSARASVGAAIPIAATSAANANKRTRIV
jgi:hypothetical protein